MPMRTTTLVAFLSASLFSSNAYAVRGVGEYRFGPETSENFACEMAKDRARDDLVTKFVGEYLDYVIEKKCVNEDCTIDSQTFRSIDGHIKAIDDEKKEIRTELGHKVCVVTLLGNVERVTSPIKLDVQGSFSYKHNELFTLKVLSSHTGGDFYLFNLYNGNYRKVYTHRIEGWMKEAEVPKEGKFKAILPEGSSESHEMMLFLYVTNGVKVKEEYTTKEMDMFLSTMPPSTRRAYRRYVTVRK